MTADDQITAFLRQERPPARDLAFESAVMRQVADRVLRQSLLVALVVSLAGGVALWAAAPALVRGLEPLANSLFSGVAVLAAAVTVLALVGPVGRRAERLARRI
jgi:hypothetical protein